MSFDYKQPPPLRSSSSNSFLIGLFLATFLRHAQVVEPSPVAEEAVSDPDDLPVLGTLLAGNADCLVTGDHELLQLKTFQGTPILSPRAFYDRFLK